LQNIPCLPYDLVFRELRNILFLKSRFACTDKIEEDILKIMHDETEGIPKEGWRTLIHTEWTKNSYSRNSGNPLAKISWMLWSYFACLSWKLLKLI
jgi:hypothetical protein